MGNRAIVKPVGKRIGVYLHWNGGRDSVEGFLKYCELRGFRGFDDDYGFARFCQVVGNFFGGTLSLGVVAGVDLSSSPGDNGVYEVKGWEIVARYPRGIHEQREYDLWEFVAGVDAAQPPAERLGKAFFRAKLKPRSALRVGDKVFLILPDFEKKACGKYEVVGFGKDGRWVNGNDVSGVPYVNRWPDSGYDPAENPNNYLFDAEYRMIRGRKKLLNKKENDT